MQKIIISIIATILFFISIISANAGFDRDDVYSPPKMPTCSITSLQLITQNGDCLIFEGEVGFGAEYSAIDGIVFDSSFWLRTTSISQSEFGTSSFTIKIEDTPTITQGFNDWTINNNANITEAYVAFGNNTIIKAGLIANSIGVVGHIKILDWLRLRSNVSNKTNLAIQISANIDNNTDIAVALEDLNNSGTLIGVINYKNNSVATHLALIVDSFFDSQISSLNIHASAQAKFDMFTLAASVATNNEYLSCWIIYPCSLISATGLEYGASASIALTDDFTIKLGGIWDDYDIETPNNEQWRIASAVEAKITESVTLTGEIGIDGLTRRPITVTYGSAELEWKPSDDFKTTIKAWGNQEGAYKFSLVASKTFK